MKGICFIEPLFNMVINGIKTQTRSIVKPQPDFISDNFKFAKKNNGDIILPRYKIGEKVYLKEPYCFQYEKLHYKYGSDYSDANFYGEWQNKLFMPEKYARYFIEITSVRCELLQNISDEDCMKEGIKSERDSFGYIYYHNSTRPKGRDEMWEDSQCTRCNDYLSIGYRTPQQAYAALIKKNNGKNIWWNNPYVWCYSFNLLK